MPEYRWNQHELAAGYDAAAEHIHPHYLELQQVILDLLPFPADAAAVLVDAGGGSGRLAAGFLERYPGGRVIVVDQSQPFLDLARQRLEPYGSRFELVCARLQDDWTSRLSSKPDAIVSMSAIHHLEPAEKRSLYRRCAAALDPGGVLFNGDEVRPVDDSAYLAECRAWAAHMRRVMDAGLVPPPMCDALLKWEARNVGDFGSPRKSGDDCHETADAQLRYFREGGFSKADVPWQKALWAVLRGVV